MAEEFNDPYDNLRCAVGKRALEDFETSFKTIVRSLKKLNSTKEKLTQEERLKQLETIYFADYTYYDACRFFRSSWAKELISDKIFDVFDIRYKELLIKNKIPDFEEQRQNALDEYYDFLEKEKNTVFDPSKSLKEYISRNNLTYEEAANYFNVTKKTIKKWISYDSVMNMKNIKILNNLLANEVIDNA